MKQGMLAVFIALLSSSLFALTQDQWEEQVYQEARSQISEGVWEELKNFGSTETSLKVDALWDLLDSGSEKAQEILEKIDDPLFFDLSERLRIGLLKLKFKKTKHLKAKLAQEVRNVLLLPDAPVKIIYHIGSHEKLLDLKGHGDLVELAQTHEAYADLFQEKSLVSKEVIQDLFYHSPPLTNRYSGGVKIFLFCRQGRVFPCLMAMRDAQDQVVRGEDGKIFTQAALASAASGFPSHQRNGDTPAGVWTLDSVMPYTDDIPSFGKFRRIIMNFVPKSANEANLKSYLPALSQTENWWRPTVVARDIGRNLFRIHGTGKLNLDPNSSHWPFIRTNGCISQRENNYGDQEFKDQQKLLETILTQMSLPPVYENHPKIKGVLYLVEIDNDSSPVTPQTLQQLGIE